MIGLMIKKDKQKETEKKICYETYTVKVKQIIILLLSPLTGVLEIIIFNSYSSHL